jgi:hypothetical protein
MFRTPISMAIATAFALAATMPAAAQNAAQDSSQQAQTQTGTVPEQHPSGTQDHVRRGDRIPASNDDSASGNAAGATGAGATPQANGAREDWRRTDGSPTGMNEAGPTSNAADRVRDDGRRSWWRDTFRDGASSGRADPEYQAGEWRDQLGQMPGRSGVNPALKYQGGYAAERVLGDERGTTGSHEWSADPDQRRSESGRHDDSGMSDSNRWHRDTTGQLGGAPSTPGERTTGATNPPAAASTASPGPQSATGTSSGPTPNATSDNHGSSSASSDSSIGDRTNAR